MMNLVQTFTLLPITGTPLTGVNSLIAIEVETLSSSWGVLSMAVINWMRWTKLTSAAGTLTGGRSLISKAEAEVSTPRIRAVCSITISQYLKMRRAKLNTHTDASGNLCVRSPIRIKRNGCYKISGASACRCWSNCPRPMYWTPIRFLGLENFFFLMSALHIVDDHSERERTLDYISGVKMMWLWYGTIVRVDIFHIIEALKDSDWMMFFVWKLSWSYCEIRTHYVSSFNQCLSSQILCLFWVLPLSSFI